MTPAPVPPATAISQPTESIWANSFPVSQRRALTGVIPASPVIVWQPRRYWRGDLLLIPGAGNAASGRSPLLALAERLSAGGWRCWLLARETVAAADSYLPTTAPLTPEQLQALQRLLDAEPAPADAPRWQEPTGRNRNAAPLRFLLAEADAGERIWSMAGSAGEFAGYLLLGLGSLPPTLAEQAPKAPVLELHIAAEARDVPRAAQQRQQRWQHLPNYQQQVLLTAARHPVPPWLGNAIDGWLRKQATSLGTAAESDALKRQMTATDTNAAN